MQNLIFIIFLTLFIFLPVKATTWNEPWHDQVIKGSDAFVKAKIIENDENTISAEVVKQLSGASIPVKFNISGYSLLEFRSISSGGGESVPLIKGETYYLFLKKSKKDNSYQIPTPTTGFAILKDGTVHATYRHSYHKALVPEEIYEKTMTAVFQGSKGQVFDKAYIESYIKEHLSQPVGVLSGDPGEVEINRFFLQHVALESIYHLGFGADLKMLTPFLDSKEYHVQISAARALSRTNPAKAKPALMKFIEGDNFGFAKVMSVWGLKRLDAKEMTPRLKAFLKDGKDEETGFGGDIMDPRIGTSFPSSVKESINSLLAEWEKNSAFVMTRGIKGSR